MTSIYGISALCAALFTSIHLTQARHALWLYLYGRTSPGIYWTPPRRQRRHLRLFLLSVACMLVCSLTALYTAFLAVGLL